MWNKFVVAWMNAVAVVAVVAVVAEQFVVGSFVEELCGI